MSTLAVPIATITLVPFLAPNGDLTPDTLWTWVKQNPDNHVDDYGSKTYESFLEVLAANINSGTQYIVVKAGDEPVGFFGYIPINKGVVHFRGICFDKSVHGTGVAYSAIQTFLTRLKELGVYKVTANYFSENPAIRKFLKKLGAVDEGYLKGQTMKHGGYIDAYQVAIFLGDK